MKLIDRFCLVRSRDAGVFAGIVTGREANEAVLTQARRIWYWDGAASLSQLALEGTKTPEKCKFPAAVPEILVLGVCEIIPCSPAAEKSIGSVPIWQR